MARKYTKRVAIEEVVDAADGFGGITQGTLVTLQTRWCYIETPKEAQASQYRNDYGLKSSSKVRRFWFRKFDFDMHSEVLNWDGLQWTPLGVEEIDEETSIVAEGVTPTVEFNDLRLGENNDFRTLEG